MPEFMLLLYDNPSAAHEASPEEIQQIIQEYGAWAARMGENGCLVSGQKLKDEGGRILRQAGGRVSVVDGPFSETKEVIGGFFQIKAESYAEAVELAKSCPHVKYGVKTEVRQIDALDGK
jgi:hypothetical protein